MPYVGMDKCNSTEHYNGLLDGSHICSGARADKPSCKVRNFDNFEGLLQKFPHLSQNYDEIENFWVEDFYEKDLFPSGQNLPKNR